MERKLLVYNSFTTELFKGNPAGVLLGADGLEDYEMQKIARELGHPETVFIFLDKLPDIRVRFFTPTEEVNLCGHATIAYGFALADEGIISLQEGENKIAVETNLGKLPIIINIKSGVVKNVFMYQDSPQFSDKSSFDAATNDKLKQQISTRISSIEKYLDAKELAFSLGIDEDKISNNIEITAGYTGLWDLLIPLKSSETLNEIQGNMEKIVDITRNLNVISLHPYYIDKNQNETKLFVRNFAPIVGIDEEGATGTSNGALISFLLKKRIVKVGETVKIIQGEKLGRKSEILGKIVVEGGINKVIIGGTAVKSITGFIDI